jgi:hypothetical protein
MRHLTLISYEDRPTGTLGLIVKGSANDSIFADAGGTLLAHDIVEHQNGFHRIGCVGDELEAIGAIWQVRGRHGTLLNEGRYWRDLYETMAGDVLNCATDWEAQEDRRWYPRFGQYHTRRHDYDEDFREIIAKARPMVESEMEGEYLEGFPIDAFFDNALHLMRMGFNKAKRRFGMGCRGADTFVAIRDAIRPNARRIDFEGQEYRLSYGDGRARCEEIYPTEW